MEISNSACELSLNSTIFHMAFFFFLIHQTWCHEIFAFAISRENLPVFLLGGGGILTQRGVEYMDICFINNFDQSSFVLFGFTFTYFQRGAENISHQGRFMRQIKQFLKFLCYQFRILSQFTKSFNTHSSVFHHLEFYCYSFILCSLCPYRFMPQKMPSPLFYRVYGGGGLKGTLPIPHL